MLVERVSDRPFAAFLRERLLEPLGMDDTGFHVPEEKLGHELLRAGRHDARRPAGRRLPRAAPLRLRGRGWGYGGAVDLETGRYGWVGGSGTAAHVDPASGTVAVPLTQRQLPGPTPTPIMRAFWAYAFG